MSLINISNLSFSYDGSYDIIFDDVGFQIDTDWKLGFIGRNGRGKTTFLNLLMGRTSNTSARSYQAAGSLYPIFHRIPRILREVSTTLYIGTALAKRCLKRYSASWISAVISFIKTLRITAPVRRKRCFWPRV